MHRLTPFSLPPPSSASEGTFACARSGWCHCSCDCPHTLTDRLTHRLTRLLPPSCCCCFFLLGSLEGRTASFVDTPDPFLPCNVVDLIHLHKPSVVHAPRHRYENATGEDTSGIHTDTGPILLADAVRKSNGKNDLAGKSPPPRVYGVATWMVWLTMTRVHRRGTLVRRITENQTSHRAVPTLRVATSMTAPRRAS